MTSQSIAVNITIQSSDQTIVTRAREEISNLLNINFNHGDIHGRWVKRRSICQYLICSLPSCAIYSSCFTFSSCFDTEMATADIHRIFVTTEMHKYCYLKEHYTEERLSNSPQKFFVVVIQLNVFISSENINTGYRWLEMSSPFSKHHKDHEAPCDGIM